MSLQLPTVNLGFPAELGLGSENQDGSGLHPSPFPFPPLSLTPYTLCVQSDLSLAGGTKVEFVLLQALVHSRGKRKQLSQTWPALAAWISVVSTPLTLTDGVEMC